jgi:hypothetical protein
MTDLLGGQIPLLVDSLASALPQVKAGKIRGLAVTSTQRSKAIPELPTVNEALGLKDYELIAYFAVFAPAGTPADIITKLNAAVNAAATFFQPESLVKACLFRIDFRWLDPPTRTPDAVVQGRDKNNNGDHRCHPHPTGRYRLYICSASPLALPSLPQ